MRRRPVRAELPSDRVLPLADPLTVNKGRHGRRAAAGWDACDC